MEDDKEQENEDFYYDDGRYADSGEEDGGCDSSNIPTYDELDIEGRYYEYGSREEYNAWRNSVIHGQNSGEGYSNNNHDEAAVKILGFVFLVVIIILICCFV